MFARFSFATLILFLILPAMVKAQVISELTYQQAASEIRQCRMSRNRAECVGMAILNNLVRAPVPGPIDEPLPLEFEATAKGHESNGAYCTESWAREVFRRVKANALRDALSACEVIWGSGNCRNLSSIDIHFDREVDDNCQVTARAVPNGN